MWVIVMVHVPLEARLCIHESFLSPPKKSHISYSIINLPITCPSRKKKEIITPIHAI